MLRIGERTIIFVIGSFDALPDACRGGEPREVALSIRLFTESWGIPAMRSISHWCAPSFKMERARDPVGSETDLPHREQVAIFLRMEEPEYGAISWWPANHLASWFPCCHRSQRWEKRMSRCLIGLARAGRSFLTDILALWMMRAFVGPSAGYILLPIVVRLRL